MIKTYGIHHVTSVVGPAQENVDFNAGVLDLRLLKKTLNFNDRHGYHLYFGNATGNTGITTTFPIRGLKPGVIGGGQVKSVQYAIPSGQTGFWKDHLLRYGIDSENATYLKESNLVLKDPSGLRLEMVEMEKGPDEQPDFGRISSDKAIIGIHSATLASMAPLETLKVLTEVMGYEVVKEDEEYYRLKVHDELGGELFLNKTAGDRGSYGTGTVHHIAFAIRDEEIEAWREHLTEKGLRPTDIKDRKYFKSIYFREKGGILFEFATEGPGFLIDEDQEHLGEKLMIPPHFSDYKEEIEKEIEPLEVREVESIVEAAGRFSIDPSYKLSVKSIGTDASIKE